ncbi:MAG: nucleotidyl transferase AbiEii/AbiGii toxin family protein [bacterium]|nr:nucleotidyl transferase AbiEii/AbiGii toxin family protein [bacterium]
MNKNIIDKLFEVFRTFDISYALIGTYAAAAWGSVRATTDIDFLIPVPPEKLRHVLEALRNQGFTTEYRAGEDRDPVEGFIRLAFQAGYDVEAIELVLGIKGMPPGIYSRSEIIEVVGRKMPVVSPEDLIILKLLADQPVDLQDAEKVYKVMKDKMDLSYLKSELNRCELSFDLINMA